MTGTTSQTAYEAAHEADLSRQLGIDHVVVFSHARIALAGILSGMGLSRGDRVLISALTCKVVPLSLISMGLEPRYADVDPDTLNLRPDAVRDAGRVGVRAAVFQHTYGMPAGLSDCIDAAAAAGVDIVEDCAQCVPRAGPDGPVGDAGRASIFSNNLMKPMSAGSGGLAVTSDPALAARVREYRNGFPPPGAADAARTAAANLAFRTLFSFRRYWLLLDLAKRLGSTYRVAPLAAENQSEIDDLPMRITAVQARAGSRGLESIERLEEHRRRLCREYGEALSGAPGLRIPAGWGDRPLYYFPVLSEGKAALIERARRRNVALVAWPIEAPIYPVTRWEELARYGYRPGSCPGAEWAAARLVGLPTDPSVGPRERDAVISLLRTRRA